MGAATQRSLREIIQAKYSFTHPKDNQPRQISCWRFTQQDLQGQGSVQGESLRWPYKFYSDQGYIISLIHNNTTPQPLVAYQTASPWLALGSLKVSVALVELLYSFGNGEVEEYLQTRIAVENHSKYIKDNLSMSVFVYSGQNLSSLAKLRLVSRAVELERYVSRGGMCAISKLYHDYQEIHDLRQELKNQVASHQYAVFLQILIQEKIKGFQGQQVKQEATQRQLESLYHKFYRFGLLRRMFLEPLFGSHTDKNTMKRTSFLPNIQKLPSLPLIVSSSGGFGKKQKGSNIVIGDLRQIQVKQKAGKKQKAININELNDLNQSLPFQCEITQINYRQKKKIGELQQINDSISMAQFSVLEQNKQLFNLHFPQQDYLVLSDYISLRDLNSLRDLKVRLVINLSANNCYNYYLKQFQYLSYYLAPLPNKHPADSIAFQYNIQHLIFGITQAIARHTVHNQPGDALVNRVVIHGGGSMFSDQNCAVVIGYLISRHLYTYQSAFRLLEQNFQQCKKNKQPFVLNKVYVDQLRNVQARVLAASKPSQGIQLNLNAWRIYQMSDSHPHPAHLLMTRYIGQVTHLNQLQCVPSHNHHFFIALSNQLVNTLSSTIQKWQKDQNMKSPQSMTGIKVLLGKDFTYKEEYLPKAKQTIPFLLKYELINRTKHRQSFNNQFLMRFIGQIVNINLNVQIIQVSFRKPKPFTPSCWGFDQQRPGKGTQKPRQPFRSGQKLTFKYPYLVPTWQSLRDDQYYFVVEIKKQGASILIVKGKNWIGLEQDKQDFFDRIVKMYLVNIDEEKIWIDQQREESMFVDQLDIK